ncbi:hypothetical protein D3C81_1461850 [compost metagenome]
MQISRRQKLFNKAGPFHKRDSLAFEIFLKTQLVCFFKRQPVYIHMIEGQSALIFLNYCEGRTVHLLLNLKMLREQLGERCLACPQVTVQRYDYSRLRLYSQKCSQLLRIRQILHIQYQICCSLIKLHGINHLYPIILFFTYPYICSHYIGTLSTPQETRNYLCPP